MGDYVEKNGLEHRLEMERLISRASQRFINSKSEEIDEAFRKTLQECGLLFDFDRVYIGTHKAESDNWEHTIEWVKNSGKIEKTQPLLPEESAWVHSKLSVFEALFISDVQQLPEELIDLKKYYQSGDIQSAFIIPVGSQNELAGVLGLECKNAGNTCSEEDKQILKTLANTLGLVLDRLRLEQESGYQLRFRELMSDISARFVNVSQTSLDQAIDNSLEEIGSFFNAERAYLFNYSRQFDTYSITHEWVLPGISPTKQKLQNVSFKGHEWFNSRLKSGEMILIKDVDQLPPSAKAEQEILKRQQVQSLMCLPITIQNEMYGMLGIDSVAKPGYWSDEQIRSFRILSTLMADVLLKNIAETDLQNVSALQGIIMNLSTGFINIQLGDIDDAIEQSLADIGQFVDADRAYVFHYDNENKVVSNTYEWCAEGIQPHIDDLQDVPVEVISDWYEKHIKNKPVIIDDVEGLPEHSEQKKVLEMQNIKSVVAFPMLSHGQYLGFVGFDSVRKKHFYSEKELKMLNVFAQMLVNIDQKEKLQNHLIESRTEAERANKAKSIFLANMSHEIRTPLNGVIGFLDMLNHTMLTSEQKSYMQSAMKSAESLMSIINDILDLSKVEAGKLELEEEVTNMHELINQSVDIIRYNAHKKGLSVNVKIGENVPEYVIVDPLRLKQILVNLIGNAVKFTEKGKVDLSLSFKNGESAEQFGYFTFEILDTGIGISEDKKDQLFKAFSQLDTSLTREYGGTGLGLIISNMLTMKMGSQIDFESEPGVGSRFYFTIEKEYLKPKEAEKVAEKDEYKKAEKDVESAPQIMVVEDTDLNRLLVKTLIKKIYPKATLVEAVNGKEAVEMFEESSPDIIFMDIQMPVMTGFEATKAIRGIEKETGGHVPVIALTASVTEGAKEKCLNSGMDYYISKPFRDFQIKEVVDRFVLNK